MKEINHKIKSVFAFISFSFTFSCVGTVSTSCTGFNNSLPSKIIKVDAVISDNTYSLSYSEDIDLSNIDMFDKNNPNKVVKTLYPGDSIEIYYSDFTYTNIDHVLVKILDYTLIRNVVAPCSDRVDFILADDSKFSRLNNEYPNYIFNNDGTILILRASDDTDKTFYGAYYSTDITDDNRIKISYIFSFDYTQR